jgi:hypothetical protein
MPKAFCQKIEKKPQKIRLVSGDPPPPPPRHFISYVLEPFFSRGVQKHQKKYRPKKGDAHPPTHTRSHTPTPSPTKAHFTQGHVSPPSRESTQVRVHSESAVQARFLRVRSGFYESSPSPTGQQAPESESGSESGRPADPGVRVQVGVRPASMPGSPSPASPSPSP